MYGNCIGLKFIRTNATAKAKYATSLVARGVYLPTPRDLPRNANAREKITHITQGGFQTGAMCALCSIDCTPRVCVVCGHLNMNTATSRHRARIEKIVIRIIAVVYTYGSIPGRFFTSCNRHAHTSASFKPNPKTPPPPSDSRLHLPEFAAHKSGEIQPCGVGAAYSQLVIFTRGVRARSTPERIHNPLFTHKNPNIKRSVCTVDGWREKNTPL